MSTSAEARLHAEICEWLSKKWKEDAIKITKIDATWWDISTAGGPQDAIVASVEITSTSFPRPKP